MSVWLQANISKYLYDSAKLSSMEDKVVTEITMISSSLSLRYDVSDHVIMMTGKQAMMNSKSIEVSVFCLLRHRYSENRESFTA